MKRKRLQIVIFICTAVALCGCGGQSGRYRDIDDAYTMINDNVGYADYLLHQIDTAAMTDRERAYYALAEAKIWEREDRWDVMFDSVGIEASYRYYHGRESAAQYPETMYYMARYLENHDSIARADHYYTTALDAAMLRSDYATAYRSAYRLSVLLAKVRLDAAVEYARRGVDLYRLVEPHNLVNEARQYVNLADKFYRCSQADSGGVYLERALSLTDSMRHSESKVKVYRDVASMYLNTLQQPDDALRYAEMMSDSAESLTHDELLLLSKCYSASSKYDDAEAINKALLYLPSIDLCGAWYVTRYMKRVQADSIRIGDDSVVAIIHYHISSMHDMQALVSQYAETAEEHRNDASSAAKGYDAAKTVLTGVIVSMVVLIIICVAIVFVIKYQTRKTFVSTVGEYRKYAQQVQQQMHSELSLRDQSIRQMQSYIYDHLSIASKLLSISDETMGMHLTAADWTELEVYLDTTSNDFVKRLRNAHPDIKDVVLRFCMMLRLGLTNRQMAVVCSIAERSVKQKAYTYKNELKGVPDGMSLREYVADF